MTWTLPDILDLPRPILQAEENIQAIIYCISKAFGASIQIDSTLETDMDPKSNSPFIQEVARDAGGCQFLGFAATLLAKYGLENGASQLYRTLMTTAQEETGLQQAQIMDFMRILAKEMPEVSTPSSDDFSVTTNISCKTRVQFEIMFSNSRISGEGSLKAIGVKYSSSFIGRNGE